MFTQIRFKMHSPLVFVSEAYSLSLVKSDHFCGNDWSLKKTLWGSGDAKTVAQCASAVVADSECGSTFYTKTGGACVCMELGETCNEVVSSTGYSIYSIQAWHVHSINFPLEACQ